MCLLTTERCLCFRCTGEAVLWSWSYRDSSKWVGETHWEKQRSAGMLDVLCDWVMCLPLFYCHGCIPSKLYDVPFYRWRCFLIILTIPSLQMHWWIHSWRWKARFPNPKSDVLKTVIFMNKNKTICKTQFPMDVTQEAVAFGTIQPTFLMHNQVIPLSFTHFFLWVFTSVVSFVSIDLPKITLCCKELN